MITADVCALRDQFNIPGTKVLQFAFDGDRKNPHLPENYSPNNVVYTATHDNPTTREWYDQLSKRQRQLFWKYLKRPESDARLVAPEMMRLAWSSSATLAIAPLQDVLTLGRDGRMNVPGRADGNWRWRATEDMLNTRCFSWVAELTSRCNRIGGRTIERCGSMTMSATQLVASQPFACV